MAYSWAWFRDILNYLNACDNVRIARMALVFGFMADFASLTKASCASPPPVIGSLTSIFLAMHDSSWLRNAGLASMLDSIEFDGKIFIRDIDVELQLATPRRMHEIGSRIMLNRLRRKHASNGQPKKTFTATCCGLFYYELRNFHIIGLLDVGFSSFVFSKERFYFCCSFFSKNMTSYFLITLLGVIGWAWC